MAFTHLPHHIRLLLLAGLYATTSTAMPASGIFARAGTCAADQVACSSELPNSFCCPSETTCKVLAGGSTVLCCPTGRNCDKIQPITCNISEQDVDKNPDAPIKTTVLDVELQKCGDETCCPFGYSCSASSECIADSDQSSLPKAAESLSSSSAAPSATATSKTSTQSETASATPVPTGTIPGKATDSGDDADGDSSESKSDKGADKTSIIGGVVGSALLVLCIAIIVYLYIRRRNRRRAANGEKNGHVYGSGDSVSSIGSFGNIISEPIVQPNSFRTDFILKTPSSQASTVPRNYMTPVPSIAPRPSTTPRRPETPPPPQIRISIPNPFDSPSPSPNRKSTSPCSQDERNMRTGTVSARLPPIRSMKATSYTSRYPATPELAREPSSESINVFADPATVETKTKSRRLTSATTFTDMMDEADLGDVRRGRPYIPGTTPKF